MKRAKLLSGLVCLAVIFSLAIPVSPPAEAVEAGTLDISVRDGPDPFNPYLGETNTITVSNRGSIPCTSVELSVENTGRTWFWENVQSSASIEAVWDGKDSTGNIVSPGIYEYTAVAHGSFLDRETGTITVTSGDSPWPMFFHDSQHTGRSPYIGPETNKVKWVFDLAAEWAAGESSIGSDGTIYLGRPEALYAIDPRGELLWIYDPPHIPWGAKTPAMGPNEVVYMAGIDGVSAITPDGNLTWNVPVAVYYATVELVLNEQGTLYYAAGCLLPTDQVQPCLIAFAPNGQVLWVYDLENGTTYVQPDFPLGPLASYYYPGATTSPTIDHNGTIYIGYEQTLFAINPDGTEKWKTTFDVARTLDLNIQTPSIGSDGTIYVGVRKAREDPHARGETGSLCVISPDGVVEWEWGCGYGPNIPLIGPDGTLYISYWNYPVSSPVGHLVALDVQAKINKWYKSWPNYGCSPRVVDAEGAIYTISQSGVRVWDADGNEKWSWRSTNGRVISLSLGQDGTLYVATGSALYAFGPGPAPVDTTAPAAVSDLVVAGATTDSVTLTWTASGDDGDTGTANTYDVRYSTEPITVDNWSSAAQVEGEAVPQTAGSEESFTVDGLVPGTTYYFVLKTADEVPNWSGISNVVSATTTQELAAHIQVDKTTVRSGDEITFDGSGSSGQIVSYQWNFDDGTIVEGSGKAGLQTHRFRGAMIDPVTLEPQTKIYTVKLTVEDDKGAAATDTASVTVEPLKTPPVEVEGLGYKAGVTALYNWVKVSESGEDIYIVSKITSYAALFRGGCEVNIHDGNTGISTWRDVYISHDWVTKRTWVSPFTPNKWIGIPCPITKLTFPEDAVEPVEVFEGIKVHGNDDIAISALGLTVGITLKPSISIIYDEAKTKFYPDSPVERVPAELIKLYFDLLVSFVQSPVELRVYDSQGNVTGLVNGEVKEEISNSDYDDDTVVILSPSDTHRYEVMGIDKETYELIVTSVEEDAEATTFIATDIPTIAGAIHDYAIDWDTLSRGEEGVTLQIDSDGDGEFEKTIAADNELTYDEFMLQTATTVDFDPDTLNLKSKGKWVTVYIELPMGYDLSQINISSIMLNGTVPALAKPTEIGDYDGDGIPDLMVKFDRAAVQEILVAGEQVVITISGEVAGIVFEGSDTIRVIDD